MPHVSIKHFPAPLTNDREAALVSAVTKAVTDAFGCDEGVVSIAVEAVSPESWNDRVYLPEIVARKELLRKTPNY
ncbi:4-oxalocrotonate tautomerase [Amycolatopsis xylanica]|uniref:4-oxalocrotonate tautomerase n=1 Tax=Amycolatopsis xylanica TaxID=589385 RepID=A0A1H3K5P4_9PSEU|nr:tautomerase family protein [Amycolatopsis xylanica]SDY47483.1 4-oxalocrotonate tautomerase [Amycolatopsis xylanica]